MSKKPTRLDRICEEIRSFHRQRRARLSAAIKLENFRRSVIAREVLGASPAMTEAERKKAFQEAERMIRAIEKGDREQGGEWAELVREVAIGLKPIRDSEALFARKMVGLAEQLPVAAWMALPEQRGAGMLNLAIVVGEAGNLLNYPNPAKLWKRMGCAPHSYRGETCMGGTWRGSGLPAEEWVNYGYVKRRRSVAYVLGDCLVKGNARGDASVGADARDVPRKARKGGGGQRAETDMSLAAPYRARYDEAKARAREAHPDWTKVRVANHGNLLCAKLFLKNLWIAWHAPAAQSEAA